MSAQEAAARDPDDHLPPRVLTLLSKVQMLARHTRHPADLGRQSGDYESMVGSPSVAEDEVRSARQHSNGRGGPLLAYGGPRDIGRQRPLAECFGNGSNVSCLGRRLESEDGIQSRQRVVDPVQQRTPRLGDARRATQRRRLAVHAEARGIKDTPPLLDTRCLPTASIAGVADDPDARRAALPKVETDA